MPFKRILSFAWQQTKASWTYWLGVFIVFFVSSVLLQLAAQLTREVNWLLYANLILLQASLEAVVNAGFIHISLQLCDEQKLKPEDFFCSAAVLGKFILGSLLYASLVTLGFILLVVPGVYWAIKYYPLIYLIVDKKMSPLAALEESAQLTEGVKGPLFLFGLLMIGLNLLGVMAFMVGLVLTLPMTMIAAARVYRHLYTRAGQVHRLRSEHPGVSPYALKK